MRTLTAASQAAAVATGIQPSVSVKLADDHEHWSLYRHDTPAKGVDGCAATVAGDGSLIRAALFDNGGGGNADLAVQRITNPTTGTQWTTWTTLVSAAAEANQPIALSNNPGNLLRLFYADGPSVATILKVFESTTNGASWTGPTTIYTGASSFFHLASAGNDDLFAARNTASGIWDVQFFKKSGGVWAAPVTWPFPTLPSMFGLSAVYMSGIYYLQLSAWYTSGIGIEAYSFDGATTWADLNFIMPVDGSALAFQYRLPSATLNGGAILSTYVTHDDGSIDGTIYDRVSYTKSIDGVHWSYQAPASPQTLTQASASPIVVAFGYYFATTPVYTWAWQVYTPGDVTRNSDLSNFILKTERRESLMSEAQTTITIDNAAGINKAPPGLVRRATLTLNEGYVDANGTEQYNVATHLVEDWYFDRAPGENQLVILAHDVSSRLNGASPNLLTFTGRTVLFIVLEICARCRIFDVFWPGTPTIGETVPSFSINAGVSFKTALHRLMQSYGLEYVVRADQSLVIHDPSESVTPSWTFTTEHTAWRLGQADFAANHVRLFGAPTGGGTTVQAETWDYTSAETESLDRYLQVVDRLIDTNPKGGVRVANELLLEQRKFRHAWLKCPVNPGFEVHDVVVIDDPDTNFPTTLFRIHGITSTYEPGKGDYDMELQLTAL